MSLSFFDNSNSSEWKHYEKVLLRFFIIYFVIQVVPLDWKYYTQIFSINWSDLYYGDLFNLSRYYPRFFSGPDTYANWIVAALIAAIGAIIWERVEKNRETPDYDNLYYWLRVILRYRLAVGVITYGFLKVFLLQAPFPSLSNLNTNYGDFTAWKIFSMSLGVAPVYEVFLGLVEIIAGFLLLYRRTASIGAFVILCFAGNVFLSNLAYEGGEHVYSLYLTVIAVFLFAFDLRRLINLLSLEKPTEPNAFNPVFANWQRSTRLALKGSFFFLFVLVFGYKSYSGYQSNPHNVPTTPGLANAAGIYNVKEFIINKDTLPYSTTDKVRWNDVVFEKWSTISIRSKRPVILDSTNVETVACTDRDKVYELAGSSGRHYYNYELDAKRNVLVLKNKNKNHANEELVLAYSRPDSNTINLIGVNENNDSIKVTLEKINKKYLLVEGRRKPQKL
jgi:hypothetical protein